MKRLKKLNKIENIGKIIILFLILSLQYLQAQPKGRIYYNPVMRVDTVDLGLCFIEGSLKTTFFLANTGDDTLRVAYQTCRIEWSGNIQHPNDFGEFKTPSKIPEDIPQNYLKEIVIIYYADSNLVTFPVGKKEAKLFMGLFDKRIYPDDTLVGINSPLDTFRIYYLIARKTVHLIDGYESALNFDSVYKKPTVIPNQIWKFMNTSSVPHSIDNSIIEILTPEITPNKEFNFASLDLQAPLPPQKVIDWNITYNPQDRGTDSAMIELTYHPYPVQYPDSSDTAKVVISGTGVEQQLLLVESNFDIYRDPVNYNDTIDIGDIRLGSSIELTGKFENRGNLPFGALSQAIEASDDIKNDFQISKPLLPDKSHLQIALRDSFDITCSPKRRGPFLISYIIESDIIKRGIYGFPNSAKKIITYIRGRGVEPILNIPNDTIDFGNVVMNTPFCHGERDSSISIQNIGNSELIIRDIIFEPSINFSADTTDVVIQGNSRKDVIFRFQSGDQEGIYNADIKLVTNMLAPNDTVRLHIKAQGVKAEKAKLSIPDIKSKPGEIINVPILISKDKIAMASTFDDTLTYDKSLLNFVDTSPGGTASEGAEIDTKVIAGVGKLSISIKMPANSFFLSRDTLINLRFNTYLGDRISFPISFSDPKFGDGKCFQVLNLDKTNGSFTLDSVCGLEYKAHPTGTSLFRLEPAYPNPAIEATEIEYEVAFKTIVNLTLFNNYGEIVQEIVNNEIPAGIYIVKLRMDMLTPGIYYCEIKAGIFRKMVPVIIAR
jgi:hypothetical protein